jgi:enoyl-[acyl-carrier protein] reductase III
MKNEIQLLETMSIIDETLPPREELIEHLRVVFSDITRYPLEIIDARADLEMDLGIDSVKLGEIFAVLRERYRLPAQDVLQNLPPERFRTIAGIADIVAEFRGAAQDIASAPTPVAIPAAPISKALPPAPTPIPAPPAATAAVPVATPAAMPAVAPAAAVAATVAAAATNTSVVLPSNADLLAEVTRTFADITRYPLDVLEADADFENDLGIDSVKLGEIFAVLRQKFDLPPPEVLRETWSAEATRTIRGIVDGIASLRPVELKPAIQPAPSVQPAAAMTPVATAAPAPRKLEGKIMLITGSGRGLGRELALHMGGLGATVLVNSFHSREAGEATTEEIRKAGGTAHHLWASVANPTQLNAMFDSIETQFGGLDFLIANASNGMLAPIDQIQPEHWEKAFRTNVIGLHQCAMRASTLMKARGGGRIVTMSSVAAHRYTDYFGCMGPIKAAVESLTKFLAVELQPHNIRVNCISAGAIYGGLVDKWPERDRLVPVWEAGAGGRLCTSADVANLMEYLLADGSSMMNGSVVVMDGGQAARG